MLECCLHWCITELLVPLWAFSHVSHESDQKTSDELEWEAQMAMSSYLRKFGIDQKQLFCVNINAIYCCIWMTWKKSWAQDICLYPAPGREMHICHDKCSMSLINPHQCNIKLF